MLYLLVWVPVFASATLVAMYLFAGERPGLKIAAAVIFLVAGYLQFFTSWALFGMLAQIGLATVLSVWWRLYTAT